MTSEPAMMAPPMAAGLIKAAMVNGDGGENDHDGHEDDDNFNNSVSHFSDMHVNTWTCVSTLIG